MKVTREVLTLLVWAVLLCVPVAAADLAITEFMASNRTTLKDEDGDSSDWVEIKNLGAETVALPGWSLTDDPAELRKWLFPNVELAPCEYLVVFASGKNRAVAGEELHLNFALRSGGEPLALVAPDGSVVSEFGPQGEPFPPQLGDISYGIFEEIDETPLVVAKDPARTWVPTDGSLDDSWTGRLFDDSAWSAGSTSIGYETAEPLEPSVALTVTTNLVLWLDATHGVATDFFGRVERWEDQLVGENTEADDAVQPSLANRPLFLEGGSPLGDRPVVRFDGGQTLSVATWLEVPHREALNPGAGGWTVFMVGQQTNADGFWIAKGNEQAQEDGYSIFGETGRLIVRAGTSEGVSGAQRSAIPDELAVLTLELTGSEIRGYRGGEQRLFRNGGGGASGNTVAGEFNNSAPLCLGASRSLAFNLNGNLAEVLIYKSQLNAEERMAVEQYLQDKWLAPAEEIVPNYRDHIATDVEARMLDVNASIYLRVPFRLDDPSLEDDSSTFDRLTLRIQYDDAFIAYLNGVEVARRGAPESAEWNSQAASERLDHDALAFETINITPSLEHLAAGDNVLAIHALNASSSDDDFLLVPVLSASRVDPVVRFFPNPTPGFENADGVLGSVAPPELSVPRGFYDAPFELSIATATPGARILYTIDGTKPTLRSGMEYTEPLTIETTAVIRAAAFFEDHIPSTISTSSYLFLDHVTSQTGDGLPKSWLRHPADYTLDPRIYDDPIYREGFVDALRALPTVSFVMDVQNDLFGPSGLYTNPFETGREWERETSVEWIVPDGSEEGFQVNAGIRIHGGAARERPKLSFRLFFRNDYGAGRLNYPVHPGSPVATYDRLVVRGGYNDTWNIGVLPETTESQYLRDQFARQSLLEMGHPASRIRYVHLYINGLYWGLYDIAERLDGAFASDHLGGAGQEDWDVMKHRQDGRSFEVLQGDGRAWDEAMALANGGLASAEAYEEFQQLVDVVSLADYMLLNFYTGSGDWPHRNWYALRPRVEGGRFFFSIWDTERSLRIPEVRRDRTGVEGKGTPARLYSRAGQNAEFRRLFGDRAQGYLFDGGLLTPEPVIERYQELSETIEDAIVCESARWGDSAGVRLFTPDDWEAQRRRLPELYFDRRTDIVIRQLRARGLYPDVKAPTFSQHDGSVVSGFRLGVSAPEGTIYVTLDGADPRLSGGAVSPDAMQVKAGAVTLERSGIVKARALLGEEWSALSEAEFTVVPAEGGLQRPGDVHQDGRRDLTDAVRLLEHLFLGKTITELPCQGQTIAEGANLELVDLNEDGTLNISDPIALLEITFLGRPAPGGGACVRIVGCPDLGCP